MMSALDSSNTFDQDAFLQNRSNLCIANITGGATGTLNLYTVTINSLIKNNSFIIVIIV